MLNALPLQLRCCWILWTNVGLAAAVELPEIGISTTVVHTVKISDRTSASVLSKKLIAHIHTKSFLQLCCIYGRYCFYQKRKWGHTCCLEKLAQPQTRPLARINKKRILDIHVYSMGKRTTVKSWLYDLKINSSMQHGKICWHSTLVSNMYYWHMKMKCSYCL